MLIKPISRKLLIHSAILNALTGKDEFRKETFGVDQNLTFVRVEPAKSRKLSSSGQYVDVSTDKVFYDLTNSRPKNTVFNKGDKFTFNNKSLIVNEVITYYALDGTTPHHYEIECF